ncbi:cAMP-regulated phosphoprotein 19-related protein [Quillaja saponaria]|uniref:cAMP-regulated phosphoprotein 19-related protein n=1 Tax=Quillaja saponaria TaxID=32244 RepID=A0AAD7LAL1_QUISA|nr:cAMP-regulated phosphoprotein 19-related protein [Quillaja saponaria]
MGYCFSVLTLILIGTERNCSSSSKLQPQPSHFFCILLRTVFWRALLYSAISFPFLLQLPRRFPTRKQTMSDTNIEDVKKQESADAPNSQVDGDNSVEDLKDADKTEESHMPSPQQEEEIIKKKYGGIVPKKPPLISKDHERAFFDSADWALRKQGAQKPKGPLEELRPKLQPTPHQQMRSRRSAYAPADDEVDGGNDGSSQDQSGSVDGSNENNKAAENKTCN